MVVVTHAPPNRYGVDDPICMMHSRGGRRPRFTWTRISPRSVRLDGLPPMLIYRDKETWAWRIVGPYTQYVSVNLPEGDYDAMMTKAAKGWHDADAEEQDERWGRAKRMDLIPCDRTTYGKLRFTWDTDSFNAVVYRLAEEMARDEEEQEVVAYVTANADMF